SGPKSVPSHSSPGSLTWLPQCSNRQSVEQPLASDGGSHCSGPAAPGAVNSGLTMPSPQVAVVQLKLQVALVTPPSSQSAWVWRCALALFVTVSPQNSMRQAPSGDVLPEQPSPLVLLPSSHCSPGSTRPLPHCWMWQSAAQVKPFGLPPEPKSLPSH